MCNVWQELVGWCRAFTRTERLLTLLECVLLAVLIGFVTFLILHFIACPDRDSNRKIPPVVTPTINTPPTTETVSTTNDSTTEFPTETAEKAQSRETLDPSMKCTWEPSLKTRATTRYYEYGLPPIRTSTLGLGKITKEARTKNKTNVSIKTEKHNKNWEENEEIGNGFDKLVMALVKITPAREVTFVCVLTVVSEWWALTAASCLHVGEDSFASLMMLERLGAEEGSRAVTAAVTAPRLGGSDPDLAALRSASPLVLAARPLRLPTSADYSLLELGERLIVLGFGSTGPTADEPVRVVQVYSLPPHACGLGGDGERHEGVCAGPGRRGGRGGRGGGCGGAPLLRGRALLGVGPRDCGGACAPTNYFSLAALRDWIDGVLSDHPL